MKRSADSLKGLNPRLILGLIVVLSLVVFLPFVTNPFFSDDYDLVSNVSRGGPFAIWTFAPSNFFRPLISLSLWLNYELGGWDTWAYYLPNFLLHAANVALVYMIAGRMLRRSGQGIAPRVGQAAAGLAALLFMTSPSHVEALYFMSCRTDLLAAFFGLLSISAFLRARDTLKPLDMVASILFLALGCLSKESVYGIALFFAGMAILSRGDVAWSRLSRLGTICGFIVLVTTVLLRSRAVAAALPYGASTFAPVGIAKAVARVGLMLVKPSIPVDPGIVLRRSTPELGAGDFLWLVVLVASVVVVAWLTIESGEKSEPKVDWRVAFGAFLATALPVCILAMPALSPESGRLMYLPSAFSAIILAFVLVRWIHTGWFKVAGPAFLACAAGFTFLNGVLYRSAGIVCDRSLSWLRASSPGGDNAVFLIPDTIGGRYVWRNGFEGALSAFAPKWSRIPHVVATYNGTLAGLKNELGIVDFRAVSVSQISESKEFWSTGPTHVIVVSPDGGVTEISANAVRMPRLGSAKFAGP